VVGQPPAVLAAAYAVQTLNGVRENLLALGYAPEADLELVLEGLTRLLPAVFVLALAALVSLNTVLAKRFLRALGETSLPEWPVFSLWQAPEHLVWVLIASGLAIAVGVWPARLVGLNLLTLTAVVYFLQGLAVAAFFCEKKHVPRPLRYLAYALLAFQQYLSLATAVVGLCDLWIDFRRLKQAAVKEA
jgi:uncharacterized protein YybS (DUF2232 family)